MTASGPTPAPLPVPERPGQVPSVGRDVHYVGEAINPATGAVEPVCWTAKITEVRPRVAGHRAVVDVERVGLVVFTPTALKFRPLADGGARQAEHVHATGTWHWPERVGPWPTTT